MYASLGLNELNSQKAPLILPSQVSYGVSIVSILDKMILS